MFKRPYKIMIGKDITRTANVADGSDFETIVQEAAAGEVVVLDKNKEVMAAGATYSDTDTIFICAGTGDTFDYTNEQGTEVTDARKMFVSDPIEGALVKSYVGSAYTASSEQVTNLTLPSITVSAGTEYILRIVFKDLDEHPGQFVQTYRYIALSTDSDEDDIGNALAALVTADKGRRVTCTYTDGTNVLALTGKSIPECTSTLTDIDEFWMVEFDAFLNYVDSNGNWADAGATKATTAAVYGSGNWEQIRDIEKHGKAYRGVTNLTHFPVLTPDFLTVKDETYDMIVIEHDKSYRSPDNQYGKETILTTMIAIPDTATSNQMDTILGVLNPWMASLPGAFESISF